MVQHQLPRLLSLLLLATILCFPFRASSKHSARTPQNDHQALVQLENYWLQSEDDPDALESILAGDFIHALPFGFITKAQQISFLRSHKRPPDRNKRHLEGLHVRVYQNAGIVNGMVVQATPAGAIVEKTVFTDVFAFRNGCWQAINAQETSLSATEMNQTDSEFACGTFHLPPRGRLSDRAVRQCCCLPTGNEDA